MPLTRRQFAALAAVLCVPDLSSAQDTPAKDGTRDGKGVFWRAKFASHEAVLFGYVRIRASFLPEMVDEGKRLIDKAETVLVDMNPGLTLPTVKFKNTDIKPVFPGLVQPYQDEFRTVLGPSFPQARLTTMSAFEAALLLSGEGQQGFSAKDPSIGLVLTDYGISRGLSVKTLATDEEMLRMYKPPDLEKVNSVSPAAIVYLLDLRRSVGPLGAYFDNLYKARDGEEIARVGAGITSRGVLTPSDFLDVKAASGLLVERLAGLPAGTNAFAAVPIGLLAGGFSILDDLKSRGADVIAID